MQGVGVGRIIHFFPNQNDAEARKNGNPGPIGAMITRVWNAEIGYINLTALPDCGLPITRSSVHHKSQVEKSEGFKEGKVSYWDWPERV